MSTLLYLTTQDRFFLSHVKERALEAQLNGFKIVVAAQKTDDKYVEKIRSYGFLFFDTQIERRSVSPLNELKAIRRIIEIYKAVRPQICHQLGAKAIIYGTLARRFAKLESEVMIVNAPIGLGYVYASNDIKARLLKPLVQSLYRLTLNPKNSFVIFENPDDLDFFVKTNILERSKSSCIYGAGVDTNIYAPSLNKNSVFTVVMASRLIKEKGVWEFVKAATILRNQGLQLKMQIVGEPDYGNPNSITKDQFECLQRNPNVECLGFREDVAEIYKKAHVCCLPSYYREGLPRCLIEGASCGLAIVTTATVGCREAVRSDNGFLIDPLDTDHLVESIKFLALNPEVCKSMGQKSRQIALDYFATETICQQTMAVYEVLKKNRKTM